jgi:hypothetical protein
VYVQLSKAGNRALCAACFVPAYLLGKMLDVAFRKAKFKKVRSEGWRQRGAR